MLGIQHHLVTVQGDITDSSESQTPALIVAAYTFALPLCLRWSLRTEALLSSSSISA